MSQQLPPIPPTPGPVTMGTTPPLSWMQAWTKALTQPSEASYAEIAYSASASSSTAYTWVFIISTISYLLSSLLTSILGRNSFTYGGTAYSGGFSLINVVCSPVVGIIAVLFFAIFVGITNLIARALGGKGTYSQLAYTVAAYSAPLSIISIVIGAIPVIGCLNIVLGIYSLVLNIIAVKATHQFGWGQAIISSVVLWVLLFILVAVIVIVVLALLGPAIGNIYSNILVGL